MDKPFQKCRLCLKLGDFCSIFEQDESVKLSDMVMSFTNIQIYEGDGLPDRVCSNCIENLSTAYLFKLQCEKINIQLQTCPDSKEDILLSSDYTDIFNKDFHMHIDFNVASENDENCVKDANTVQPANRDTNNESSVYYDTSDSDVDSIKCVYCNESYNTHGAHRCNVTCTIEHNELQRSSSNETLVATDVIPPIDLSKPNRTITGNQYVNVCCVLCDAKYDSYKYYVLHFNSCTNNVKLHHYVCPICHEIYTEKLKYLEHLKVVHFKDGSSSPEPDAGIDCVDFAPIMRVEKTRRPHVVRRQIGWSIEDIYQEIECKKVEEKSTPNSSPSKYFTPTSSPFKTLFSKLGNESFSKQSTPKKVSFRQLIENGKAKTSNIRKYIQNYKLRKSVDNYSPMKNKKVQVSSVIRASLPESDSDYHSPSGTSEESWKMKQNLICACDKKVFMLSEFLHDRDRIVSMIHELGGVVAENTKMEMLATHFISVLPNDTFTGMMVCALATGKWLLNVSFVFDSFRCKKFLRENMYEWVRHPKILEIETSSVEVAKAAGYWHVELQSADAKLPFEGKQVVLIMKKKYRQYYQMIFKTLKAKPVTYDPRTPGSCCSADYCFVDMRVIERVKLSFFARHNVPVFPYQYILVYLLKRGRTEDEHQYLVQECKKFQDQKDLFNNTF